MKFISKSGCCLVMENVAFFNPHLHKIILKIYTQKIYTTIFSKKMVVYLSKIVENYDSQIWKNDICPRCPHILSNIFEVFWYKKSHKYGVHGPRNDQ